MCDSPQRLSKKRKIGQKYTVIRAKFGFIKVGQIPFSYWVIFNLTIRTEEARVHHTRPKCASNKIRAIFERIQYSGKLCWTPPSI